jgi:transglutaminase-like putative cysteine protease
MRFQIEHRTSYEYIGAASESFMEARLTPVTDDRQRLISRTFVTAPACNVYAYRDYFGNWVETLSIVHRHQQLHLTSRSVVETRPAELPRAATDISVAEAQQIYRAEKLAMFEYLQASPAIEQTPAVQQLAKSLLPASAPIGASLLSLNNWIAENLRYLPGSTRIDTPVSAVLECRTGVCQDFAQLMIAILRSAGIPARYVTGYIETDEQQQAAENNAYPALVGASESHAWVEVYLPGGFWWALDPTNHCAVGERHVKVASGRDYQDCTPTRGVFKGTASSNLKVSVRMVRSAETAELPGILNPVP